MSDEKIVVDAGEVSKSDKDMGLILYLSTLVVGFWGPLIIWLIKKDESKFLNETGKEALNFFLTLFIYSFVSVILCLILIGFVALAGLIIVSIVFSIIAALEANKGNIYRFPRFLCIKFLK